MIVLPFLLKYHKKLKESEVVTANSSCHGNVISHYSSLNSSKKLFSCFRMTLHFALLHPCFIACVIALLQMNAVEAKIHVYNQDGEKVQSFFDREWEYGGMLVEPIQGFIVVAEPPDACTKVAEPTFLSNFTVGKFILIKGNENCSNILKVRNAERAGYDVAVIFDPDPLPLQFVRTVPFPGSENKIPAIFIAYEDGVVIRENYQFNNSFLNNYILEITPNSQDMSYYLMLFALVIGVCFIIMLLFMICLLIKCIQERRKRRRNRLSTRQIKQVPTAKFSKGDQYDVCAICLEDYNEGDKLRILPCEHAYHAKCVDPWLMNNRRNCPLCKRKITFGDSPAGSDSEDSELASPAENTPLIGTPVHYGPPTSWGTFTTPTNHPVTPLTNLGFDGLEIQQPNTSQANLQRVMATIESSDEELIACLAPSDCSVNNSRDNSPVGNSEEEAIVHVSYVTVADSNGCASSGQHGFIV